MREGGGRVRDGVGGDEMLLEAGLDRGLDLVDAGDERLDLAAGGDVEQRDAGAGAGGVAGGGDPGEVAVGDHAEDHRVSGRDVGAEGSGEHDAVDGVGAELVHQQAGAGVEGGFAELDGADVALGDEDVAVQAVGVGAALGDQAPVPVCSAEPIRPEASTRPAARISAMASMMPEPQMPVTRAPPGRRGRRTRRRCR